MAFSVFGVSPLLRLSEYELVRVLGFLQQESIGHLWLTGDKQVQVRLGGPGVVRKLSFEAPTPWPGLLTQLRPLCLQYTLCSVLNSCYNPLFFTERLDLRTLPPTLTKLKLFQPDALSALAALLPHHLLKDIVPHLTDLRLNAEYVPQTSAPELFGSLPRGLIILRLPSRFIGDLAAVKQLPATLTELSLAVALKPNEEVAFASLSNLSNLLTLFLGCPSYIRGHLTRPPSVQQYHFFNYSPRLLNDVLRWTDWRVTRSDPDGAVNRENLPSWSPTAETLALLPSNLIALTLQVDHVTFSVDLIRLMPRNLTSMSFLAFDRKSSLEDLLRALPPTLRDLRSDLLTLTTQREATLLPKQLEEWHGLEFSPEIRQRIGLVLPSTMKHARFESIFPEQLAVLPASLTWLEASSFNHMQKADFVAPHLKLVCLDIYATNCTVPLDTFRNPRSIFQSPRLRELELSLKLPKGALMDSSLWPISLTKLLLRVDYVQSPTFWTSFPQQLRRLEVMVEHVGEQEEHVVPLFSAFPRGLTDLQLSLSRVTLEDRHLAHCPPLLRHLDISYSRHLFTPRGLAQSLPRTLLFLRLASHVAPASPDLQALCNRFPTDESASLTTTLDSAYQFLDEAPPFLLIRTYSWPSELPKMLVFRMFDDLTEACANCSFNGSGTPVMRPNKTRPRSSRMGIADSKLRSESLAVEPIV